MHPHVGDADAADGAVNTGFVSVSGKPFDMVVNRDHVGFVSLRKGPSLVVMNTARFMPAIF